MGKVKMQVSKHYYYTVIPSRLNRNSTTKMKVRLQFEMTIRFQHQKFSSKFTRSKIHIQKSNSSVQHATYKFVWAF